MTEKSNKVIMTEKQQAKILHDAWCVWMKNYFSLSEEQRKAAYPSWQRLMNTAFDDLTDDEAKSDYEVAEKVFPPKEPAIMSVEKTYSIKERDKYNNLLGYVISSGFMAKDVMEMYEVMQKQTIIGIVSLMPVLSNKALELISLTYEFQKYNFLADLAAGKDELSL